MTISHTVAGGFEVLHPGMLSMVQDHGRLGMAKWGLTTGGPADKLAFDWANRLLGNDENAAAIEVAFGGLKLRSLRDTQICVTGAESEVLLNGQAIQRWQTHNVQAGDEMALGFARCGVRCYVAVKGGLQIEPQFGSCSTVVREGIGGLSGKALVAGDVLPSIAGGPGRNWRLLKQDQPSYPTEIRLRVVPGYQQAWFSRLEQRRFFSSVYQVSKQWDRMGYRLQGAAIECQQREMLSEGICLGAIQFPPDGQPIVLMQDRQTIGGYPKIGSVLSLDLYRLAQCGEGTQVYFEPISMETAHNELLLARRRFLKTKPIAV